MVQVHARIDRMKINHREPKSPEFGHPKLMVTLAAPPPEDVAERPRDLVVVLDTSGSMDARATEAPDSPTKIELARRSARALVEQLSSEDRLALVTYSGEVTVHEPLVPLTPEHRSRILSDLHGLPAHGGTDLVSGALRGLSLLAAARSSSNRTSRVMLMTDGFPTVGLQKFDAVTRAIAAKQGKTSITTIGFGAEVTSGMSDAGYDPELLTAIARSSGGSFYHAQGVDGLLRSFGLELGSLRSVAAVDVQIRIRPGAHITAKVLSDVRHTRDGEVVTIDVGSLYADERTHLIVELEMSAADKCFPRDTLAAAVEVTGVASDGNTITETRDVMFRYVSPNDADARPDTEVLEQCIRIRAAECIASAHRKAKRGAFAQAAAMMADIRRIALDLGTPAMTALAESLAKVERDVGNELRFARNQQRVHATSRGLHTERATGDSYTDGEYETATQTVVMEAIGEGIGGKRKAAAAGMNPDVRIGADPEEVRPNTPSTP